MSTPAPLTQMAGETAYEFFTRQQQATYANGNGPPHGYTVTKPDPSGRSTVTFNTTAVASNGTPA